MGFEPTTSAVTGRRSDQLSHQAKRIYLKNCTQYITSNVRLSITSSPAYDHHKVKLSTD